MRQSMLLRWPSVSGALLSVRASSEKATIGDEAVHLQHLIGPEGEVLIQYEATARPDQIGQSIADEMADYKQKNPAWHGCVRDPSTMVLSVLPCTPATLCKI